VNFYNVRIVNKVDQDGDEYARSFRIEFDVASTVAGNSYVKIYENNGSTLLDDCLTQGATFAVNGIGTD